MLLNIIFLIAGLIILTYGADLLVDGGAALAHRLKVSAMVIGLTIVAFGTSAPELVVNIVSSAKGSSALALGNVMGSNIFNILAILGVTALSVPVGIRKTTARVEIPLSIFAASLVLFFVYVNRSGDISRAEGVCLLCAFVLFLAYTLALAKYGDSGEEVEIKNFSTGKSLFFIVAGLAGLIAGGHLLVTEAVQIARDLGISERVIGLTVVSIGTSLPELATSVIAARKKNADIAIGNVIGSNLFNTFLILGTSAVIAPLKAPAGGTTDLWVNLAATLLLFLFILTGKGRRLNRWEGGVFLVLYLGYLLFILNVRWFDFIR